MTQDQIIKMIKDLKDEMRQKFDENKLIRLYYLIDQLEIKK